MATVAHMERTGVPLWQALSVAWAPLKERLIGVVDALYGVYDGATFKTDRFIAYLQRERIPWPLFPDVTPIPFRLFCLAAVFQKRIFCYVTQATLASVARALLLRPSLRLIPHIPTLPHREKTGDGHMANAQCLCGALSLKLRETSKLIVACHCLACQRRTGSPFGLGVFHAIDTVEITGTATEFIHVGDSGRKVRCYFCPTCGSTVYWKPDVLPSLIGVAVGALGDPGFPAPAFSIFERSKHHWVHVEAVEHFQKSGLQKGA
jgi:hypothetical protein